MQNGGYVTGEQLRAGQHLKTADVPTRIGTFRVREMTSAERVWWESESYEAATKTAVGEAVSDEVLRTRMIVARMRLRNEAVRMCLVDDQGRQLLADGEREVVDRQPNDVVRDLWDKIAELSGMLPGAREAAPVAAEGFSGGTVDTVPSSESPST